MNTAITTLEQALSSLRKCDQSDETETARIEQEIRDHEDALGLLRSQVRPSNPNPGVVSPLDAFAGSAPTPIGV